MVHSPDPQETESPSSLPAGDVTLPYAKWQGRKRRNWRRIAFVLLAVVCIGGAFTVKHFGGTFREAGICSNCYHIETRRVWYLHKTRLRTVTVGDVSQKRLDWNDLVAEGQPSPCRHRHTWYADSAQVDADALSGATGPAYEAMIRAKTNLVIAEANIFALTQRLSLVEMTGRAGLADQMQSTPATDINAERRRLDAAQKEWDAAVNEWDAATEWVKKLNTRLYSGG